MARRNIFCYLVDHIVFPDIKNIPLYNNFNVISKMLTAKKAIKFEIHCMAL